MLQPRYFLRDALYKLYERVLWRQIRNGPMPEHIALILDGCRRWSSQRSYPPWYGHEVGASKAMEFLDWCYELGVKIVTLYAFSIENFQRKRDEVSMLMRIFEKYLKKGLHDKRIDRYGICVKFLGRINLLPPSLRELIYELEEKTRNNKNFYLNIAIAYGGRAELVDAIKKISKDVKDGKIAIEEIDENLVEQNLYTAHLYKPSPDLIIRTSGEERISGFLLWQLAYSELVFLDVPWPDFRKVDLWRAIRTYQRRERRFGR